MLPLLSLNNELSGCEPILLSIPRKLSKRRVEPDAGCQPSRHHDFTGGRRDMSTLRQIRNFSIPWVTTIARLVQRCGSTNQLQGYRFGR